MYDTDYIKDHPAVVTKHKYLSQFRDLSQQLGLSPASRAQLAGLNIKKKEDDEDPLLKILKGVKTYTAVQRAAFSLMTFNGALSFEAV